MIEAGTYKSNVILGLPVNIWAKDKELIYWISMSNLGKTLIKSLKKYREVSKIDKIFSFEA
tara:strand:+ start:111 stop:293 length:183 start_codon:yes stop_codon:yes gene_type:complete